VVRVKLLFPQLVLRRRPLFRHEEGHRPRLRAEDEDAGAVEDLIVVSSKRTRPLPMLVLQNHQQLRHRRAHPNAAVEGVLLDRHLQLHQVPARMKRILASRHLHLRLQLEEGLAEGAREGDLLMRIAPPAH
jgi:hypothetical protein